ncbi:UTP--glucose-1-phosphate uridylyltransferase GalU [Parachitinimonas caeni]|uniref:UTP--glucose-1-phosphate uridylyltransferase n=1 Tax=Parachitinimonas caeni TaxID=3031301 RepID=A0ABT7DWA0_9NEIS|nr:UTP--glucose-1-phosphate uridylyltransferase GalU [Parachitinimonas caeni]MDK2124338.1 UTP--glucose-1-phosphate uridylyltransferase GalU [Parachitinimonas caeni]
MQKIKKAVFPVAGLGTRFLPATKASPKEMLNVVDKPLIQYAVEEAVAAGITEMIFVTGRTKRAIEDHFDKAYELESELAAKHKHKLLELVQSIIPKTVTCAYVRQPEALGLGHAVLCAQPLVGDEPFAIILADDLIDSDKAVMRQMVELFDDSHSAIIGVETVPQSETGSYGIVVASEDRPAHWPITQIVEKPKPAEAPSNLAVVGRYIMTPRIFHHLLNVKPGAGGEIQLTDAIAALLKEEQVLAWPFDGVRYDCGNKIGYLKATLAFARKHPEVGDEFAEYLRSFCEQNYPA